MNAIVSHALPPHLLAELALHLRNSGSECTVAQAATEAIRAWIAANARHVRRAQDHAGADGAGRRTHPARRKDDNFAGDCAFD
jgi:hypothetical protein